jgi:WD40 repeat protein
LWASSDHTEPIYGVRFREDGHILVSGSVDGTVRLWTTRDATCVRVLQADRRYERLDITGLTGITDAQRSVLLSLGAFERENDEAR